MTAGAPWAQGMSVVTARRTRPSHARRNDALIPEAVVQVIVSAGWDEFSLSKVAGRINLAKAAVHRRYRSRASLASQVWHDTLFPTLTDALAQALRGVPEVTEARATDQPSTRVDAQAGFQAAMERFAYPDSRITAAIELLLGSLVDPDLTSTVRDPMTAWLLGRYHSLESRIPTPADLVHDARVTAVLVWAFGLTLFARRPWVSDMDLTSALGRAYAALQDETEIRDLPPDRATYLKANPFHTDDPRVDAACEHALSSIGSIGYQRTRLVDIAASGQVSEAFLLQRFKTKLGLMQSIIDTTSADAYRSFTEYQERLAQAHGTGIAEAMAWREYLNPEIRDRQVFGIETARLINIHETMSRLAFANELDIVDQRLVDVPIAEHGLRRGDTHLEFASGWGLPVVGVLVPQAWTLPLNVVTEPLTTTDPFHQSPHA